MRCPSCGASATKVMDSRMLQKGSQVKRRRKCEQCRKRFTTYEKLEINMPLVIKNDGRREKFTQNKILNGLHKACQKRPIPLAEMERVIEVVKKSILDQFANEISSREIGNIVMDKLYQLDPVAYVRFASFYWNFKNIEEFFENIQTNLKRPVNIRKETFHELT